MSNESIKLAAVLPVGGTEPDNEDVRIMSQDEGENVAHGISSSDTGSYDNSETQSIKRSIKRSISHKISRRVLLFGASRSARKSTEETLVGKYAVTQTLLTGVTFKDRDVEEDYYLSRVVDRIALIKDAVNALLLILPFLIVNRVITRTKEEDFALFDLSEDGANVTLIQQLDEEIIDYKKFIMSEDPDQDEYVIFMMVFSLLSLIILRIVSMKTEWFIR
jgi:hypothetical protein